MIAIDAEDFKIFFRASSGNVSIFNSSTLENGFRLCPDTISRVAGTERVVDAILKVAPDKINSYKMSGMETLETLQLLHSAGYKIRKNTIREMLRQAGSYEKLVFINETMAPGKKKIQELPHAYTDAKMLRYAIENLGHELRSHMLTTDREIFDLFQEHNEICAIGSPELLEYAIVKYGYVPTEYDSAYLFDMIKIEDYARFFVDLKLPVCERWIFLSTPDIREFLRVTGVTPKIQDLMLLSDIETDVLEMFHEEFKIDLSSLVSWLDDEDDCEQKEYILSTLGAPKIQREATYKGNCPICLIDCDTSFYSCGHAIHLECYSPLLFRCPSCHGTVIR